MESQSNGASPSKDYCMIWIICDAARGEVHAILSSLPSWAANIKATGTRIVIFGRQGPQYKRPAVQVLVDNRVLHISKHWACYKPLVLPEPGAKHSQVSFTVLTAAPIPNQLCRCDIKLEDHVDDWTSANRHAFAALMCREVLSLAPSCCCFHSPGQ